MQPLPDSLTQCDNHDMMVIENDEKKRKQTDNLNFQ